MSALERHYRIWLLILWCAAAAAAIIVNRGHITGFRFWDPDDVMRLLEVRDWLNGQSWFDVSQHRMNWPAGLAMHWSRWVDLPLAIVIRLFTPWIGQRSAEMIAATLVPLITLGMTMTLVGGIARALNNAAAGLLASAFCLLSIGTWYAMQPMRIDHHGWQIVAGLALVRFLIARQDRRSACATGICAALWMQISIEGLAFTACTAAWLGWLGLQDSRQRTLLPAFLIAITVTETVLYTTTNGAFPPYQNFCDRISPIHLAAFGSAALATAALVAMLPERRFLRAGGLVLIAIGCAALYRLETPQCAAGPFGLLGPLGYKLWYVHVQEGMPLWRAGIDTRISWGLFPWIGLAGALAAYARHATRRPGSLAYCVLLAGAVAIAMLVTRAGAFANLLAIPGAVGLILRTFEKTDRWAVIARLPVRVLAILLLSPLGAALAPALLTRSNDAPSPPITPGCGKIDTLAPLDRFAPAVIVAPLELGPALLAGTHHRAITGPYHRDAAALEDVLRFFTATDARAIAMRRSAAYVAFCPEGEMATMARFAPAGLAAQLLRRAPPSWLTPVVVPGTAGLQLYRITR
jgi:hypothetical protein